MKMKLTIHRGTNEIGGNCIEIATDKTRLLLDVGQPLSGEEINLSDELKKVDAVVISHPHQDHFGLLDQIPQSTPVFMGETGVKLIQATRLFMGQPLFQNNFKPIGDRIAYQIGELTVTPYLVDHSAFDSYAVLVEGHSEQIFYTGDFRMHGRKKSLMDKLLSDPPGPVDILVTEGTMLDRTNEIMPSETDAEQAMTDLLEKTEGAGFLICSAQNLDRLVTAFRACIRTSRVFVIDIYTAWILRQIALDPRTAKIPDISWDGIRVLAKGLTAGRHYEKLKSNRAYFGGFPNELYEQGNLITHEEIRAEPDRFLIKNSRPEWLIARLDLKPCSVIYSMWEGYLKEEHNLSGWRRLTDLKDDPLVNFQVIHTSGHAVLGDLRKLVEALMPGKIVPIHTEDGDRLMKFFGVNSNNKEI
jgi:ribonuclease J